ncbi:MAG: arsenate reductase ArsC [Atopobium sp.]|jgi:arsenate reductase|nr:arsenate reductase ArsC [Atopobium sp.]
MAKEERVTVIAFVCTHNACRSQMAEAMARTMMPAEVEMYSAGTKPAPQVDSSALAELARRGIDARGLRPKALRELPSVDWLITMGCGVSCPALPCRHREDWGLTDPTGGPAAAYKACADAIEHNLHDLRDKLCQERDERRGV